MTPAINMAYKPCYADIGKAKKVDVAKKSACMAFESDL